MKRHETLSIIITFIMGLFAGFYLYLFGFTPLWYGTIGGLGDVAEVSDNTEAVVRNATFTVTSEAYGGCSMIGACPRFRLEDDGSYRYFYTPGAGEDEVLQEGVLPLPELRRVKGAMQVRVLEAQAQSTQPSFCNSYVDGLDLRYSIQLDDEVYELDSCGTAVDGDSVLWQALANVWNYFETAS